MTRFVYLHGFASSPQSTKAQFFERAFAERGLGLEIPSLDQGNFERLTITNQLELIEDTVGSIQAVLIGSSLGGYLAALYASRHPNIEKLVLLAPAFHFTRRWEARYSKEDLELWKSRGSTPIYHYGFRENLPLGYHIVEDARRYEAEPSFPQPALILHGVRDDVVPARISEAYAASHSNVILRLFESGHELVDVLPALWGETLAFLGLGDQRPPPEKA